VAHAAYLFCCRILTERTRKLVSTTPNPEPEGEVELVVRLMISGSRADVPAELARVRPLRLDLGREPRQVGDVTLGFVVGAALVGLGLAHLVYTYVGYPWIMSWLPERPPRPGLSVPPRLISVVIAARARRKGVAHKVKSLLRTIRLPCEIVVVLDGPDAEVSSEVGELVALRDERIKVSVLPDRRGKAAALNHAVAIAAGDVLVFTDVRQEVAAGAVERLVANLASPDVGAVSGSLAISSASGSEGLYERYWRFERWLRSREAAWDSSVGVSGALYALRRELWSPLPHGLLLDDVWVPFQVVRAGFRVVFDSLAVTIDVPSPSDATELDRKIRTLTGNYQLIAWMPTILIPWKNRIWWQFISHKVLRLLTPFAAASVLIGVVLMSGGWAGLIALLAALGLTVSVVARPSEAPGAPGRGFRGTVRSGLALLAALMMAALNAARGRWDVWTDPVRPHLVDTHRS